MNDHLPEGWSTQPLSALALEFRTGPFGSALHQSDYVEGGIPVINPTHLMAGKIRPSRAKTVSRATAQRLNEYALQEGDIVIARRGEMGRCAVVGTSEIGWLCGTGSAILRLRPDLLPAFVQMLLSSPAARSYLSEASVGSTMENLNQQLLKAMPITVPPLAEQRRIVAQIEALLTKVRSSQERLDKLPTILKRFRQAVLAAACTGRLTADWRQKNPGADARRVVDRLRTEPPQPYRDVFERSSESEVPESWVWVPLGRLGPMSGGGTPSKESPRFWNGKIPWVSPKDMKRDRISDSEDHITTAAIDESSTKRIPAGSILFVTRGMILNHTLPTAITDSVVTLNQDMKALTPDVPEMSEYLFIASKYLARQILFEVKEATHGTRRIETPLLKNWAVPVAPLDEQREIVLRVNALLSLADRLEGRYEKAKAQVDKLTQSVLAKAFRGELVVTEAELARREGRSYETAEELLTRVTHAQQATRPTKKVGLAGGRRGR